MKSTNPVVTSEKKPEKSSDNHHGWVKRSCFPIHLSTTMIEIAFFLQEKNGGAMKVESLATVVFQGTAEFTENSVKTSDRSYVTEDGEYVTQERTRKGGALHNKVFCHV